MNPTHCMLLVVTFNLGFSARADLEFKAVPSNVSSALRAAAWGGGGGDVFVAVGAGALGSSATYSGATVGDTLVWAPVSLPAIGLGMVKCVVSTPAGVLLAAGEKAAVFTSTDGKNWTTRANAFENLASVNGLAYNNGRFIAVSALPNITWASAGEDGVPGPWSNATNVNLISVESYRSITAFGTNEFALCGIRGVIRTSTGRGTRWLAVRPLELEEPDLLGIAWDGKKTLVCVGKKGRILTSTNGEASAWSMQDWTGGANLNAVGWTGYEFIVAGDGGLVLTSPDGTTWSESAKGVTTQNLYGVTCATSGSLKDVSVLVGDAGTVVIAGATTPPRISPPANPVNQTNCAGSVNIPLQVSLAQYMTGDWYTSPAGANLVTRGVASYTPETQIPNATSVSNYWVETRDMRTQFVNTNRTPVMLRTWERPTSRVSGDATICIGGSTIIRTDLTGHGPWTVVWASNRVAVATNNVPVGETSDSLRVGPVNSGNAPQLTTYTIVALSDANCSAEAGDLTGSALITVNPSPTVARVDNRLQTVCNGATTLAVNFEGVATHYAWVNDTPGIGLAASGTGNIAPFAGVNTGVIPVVATVTITPHYVNGGEDCTGASTNVLITVNPTATVNLVTDQGPFCNGASAAAIGFSSPVAGTSFAWMSSVDVGFGTSGGGNIAAYTAVNASTGPLTATVTVTPTANGCVGTARTFTVTVNPTATVNLLANPGPFCNGASAAAIGFSSPVAGTSFAWTSTVDVGFGTSGDGNIAAHTAVNAGTEPVTATVTVTPTANGCAGTARTFTVTVNPTATVNLVASQGPFCNGAPGAGIGFSGPVGGTSFAWTSSVNVGFGTSGDGNIAAYTAVNALTEPVTATVTVTPTANGCVGPAGTFTVTVNPTATVNVVANQGPYCNGSAGAPIGFSGPVAGTSFAWTSSSDVGFGTTGTGNIAAYTSFNAVAEPVTATVTVTPTANGCLGTARTFTVTVNPTATVNLVANQGPYCNGAAGAPIRFSGPVAGTSFAWISSVDLGFGTSGNGDIAAYTPVNALAEPVTATVTVTPSANGCVGTARSFTVTVNSSPAAPVASVDVSNCVVRPNPPLAVTVPAGIRVNWYDAPSGGNLVAANTLSFSPTNRIVGDFHYYAEAVGSNGCSSLSRTRVTLTIGACPDLLRLHVEGNQTELHWFGGRSLYVLELPSADFANWMLVTKGVGDTINTNRIDTSGTTGRLYQLRP